jgi:hypothetical protein
MFGDTEAIAEAVAAGLSARMTVQMVEVSDAGTTIGADIDLLVTGAPTHAFSLSRPSTRDSASHQAGGQKILSPERGIREWLEDAVIREGLSAAAFDTKLARPRLPGSAAHAAERRLRKKGCKLIGPAGKFLVTSTQGPLSDGELVRARAWGAALAAAVTGQIDRSVAGD